MNSIIAFRVSFLILAAGCLTGCENPYTSSYISVVLPGSLPSEPIASTTPAQIIKSSNLHADILRLKAQGYVVLGHSAFKEPQDFGASLVLVNFPARQAKIVGADIVLLTIRNLGETKESGFQNVTKSDASGNLTFEDEYYSIAYDTYKYVAVFLRRPSTSAPVPGKTSVQAQ
jgi:hypothetical protein